MLDDFDVVARLDAAVAEIAHDCGVPARWWTARVTREWRRAAGRVAGRAAPHHVANDLLVGAVKHSSSMVHRGARLHVVLDAVGVVVDTVPARAVGLRSRHEGREREEESTLGTHRGSLGVRRAACAAYMWNSEYAN